ncbi:hypothetical protein EPO15_03715 [bacterium]|nr:MAG: hypothetical protein EPO15_03715 [bacterium]
MRWWTLALLSLALPAAADPGADEERAKRLSTFAEQHKLADSKLYGSLAAQGYIQHADVHAGPPDTLRFGALVDGKPAVLLFLPAAAGDPPRPEGLYLEAADGAPRPLSPDPRSRSLNQALAGAVRAGRNAPPPQKEDPANLERFARDSKVDPAMRDAVGAAFDGGARRRELETRIAAKEADIARQRAASDRQWARTPGVAARVESHLRSVVPPAISPGEIAKAAHLDAPVVLPPAPKSGRPAVVLVVSGEKDGARAEAALKAHKEAVKKDLMARLGSDPLSGARDLWNARSRNPEAAAAVVDASPGLRDGARQATAGLSELPHVGAGIGVARDPAQAAKGERFVGRPRLFGRIARRKIDQQTDVGEAAERFARERAGIVGHAGDVAALEVLKARERLSASFAQAGYAKAPVLAVGDPAASAALTASVGGRGAFLQYRTSAGGSYFLPLTPDPALTAGHADFPDVAARADARVAKLAGAGALTREAALTAWTDELRTAWGLSPDAAAALARRIHGAR